MSLGFDPGPYKCLLSAVMALAINDARAYIKREKLICFPDPLEVNDRNARGAIHWLASDSKHPGGFLWCCDLFDLHPDYVRMQILRARPDGVVKQLINHFETVKVKDCHDPQR